MIHPGHWVFRHGDQAVFNLPQKRCCDDVSPSTFLTAWAQPLSFITPCTWALHFQVHQLLAARRLLQLQTSHPHLGTKVSLLTSFSENKSLPRRPPADSYLIG